MLNSCGIDAQFKRFGCAFSTAYTTSKGYKNPNSSNTNNGTNGYYQKAGKVKVSSGTIVRAKNDSSSSQVGYIDRETTLDYSELVGGWYYVILPDGTRGYIYSSRCTEIK